VSRRCLVAFCAWSTSFHAPTTADLLPSFDSASLAILDRLNHVVTLLETRPTAPPDVSMPSPQSTIPHAASALSQGLPNEVPATAYLEDPNLLTASVCCEEILRWPILNTCRVDFQSFVLDTDYPDIAATTPGRFESSLGRGVQEEDFIHLSRRFLALVHVKNPILDVSAFKKAVKQVTETGPQWDGTSCLVVRPLSSLSRLLLTN
jgi:hypothetical protein